MKKLILIIAICFFACSADDVSENKHIFNNTTEFTVVVSPIDAFLGGSPDFEITIQPRTTKTYKTKHLYSLFEVWSNQTNKNFNYKLRGNTNEIYSFDNKVLYKITGTATSVDLTYNGSSGSTIQETVSLPYEKAYNVFNDSFKYISAQKNNESGTLLVELFIEDKLIDSDSCSSSFCIATASN